MVRLLLLLSLGFTILVGCQTTTQPQSSYEPNKPLLKKVLAEEFTKDTAALKNAMPPMGLTDKQRAELYLSIANAFGSCFIDKAIDTRNPYIFRYLELLEGGAGFKQGQATLLKEVRSLNKAEKDKLGQVLIKLIQDAQKCTFMTKPVEK